MALKLPYTNWMSTYFCTMFSLCTVSYTGIHTIHGVLNHMYSQHWLLLCYGDRTFIVITILSCKSWTLYYMLLENMNQHWAPITHSRNAASCHAGAFDTSSDAPLLPILNADNAPLSEGAFKVKLPPTLTTTLLSYVTKWCIQEMCTVALLTNLFAQDI